MNRDFYFFGIFFLGLYVIAALFQSIIFFQIGYQIYSLPSFANWFLVLISASLIGYVFMLKYYHHKGYRFAFTTGAIAVIAGLCQNILFYLLLLLMLKSLKADEEVSSHEKSSEFLYALGGYGTWYFIGTRPDRFAAAVPVAGEGDPDLAPNMLDIDIWAFHGANDRNVPVSGSREVIEAIRKAGGGPHYTESPDGGHSWKIVEDTPGVLDWLFAQKRD